MSQEWPVVLSLASFQGWLQNLNFGANIAPRCFGEGQSGNPRLLRGKDIEFPTSTHPIKTYALMLFRRWGLLLCRARVRFSHSELKNARAITCGCNFLLTLHFPIFVGTIRKIYVLAAGIWTNPGDASVTQSHLPSVTAQDWVSVIDSPLRESPHPGLQSVGSVQRYRQ